MITEFNSKSKNWDESRYYKIFEKDGDLWIKFIGQLWRGTVPQKGYLVWCVTTYDDRCEKKLNDMYDFDFLYQMDKLLNSHVEKELIDIEPTDALWLANSWVKGNGEGSKYLNPIRANEEDFVPGYYFG